MTDTAPVSSRCTPGVPVRQSFAQQRLWFLHQLNPDSPQHNILVHIDMDGVLEPQRLQAAFTQMVERQTILRTRYCDSPSGPQQWIDAGRDREDIHCIDLASLGHAEQNQEYERAAQRERARAFNLREGPVVFAYLFRLSPEKHRLLFNIHHIAFDGRSLELLFVELAAGYRAALGSNTNGSTTKFDAEKLPVLPWEYADFAQCEPELLDTTTQNKLLNFWRTYLEGVPTDLQWPHRRADLSDRAHHCRFLSEAVFLEKFARNQNLTLFQTLLTLFSVWLHYLCRQERFLVGTDIHGRTVAEAEDLMGFFVNQLCVKCDLTADPTLLELFARTRRNTRQAYGHYRLPFDILVSALAPERKRSRAPLFQVKLNYQPYRITTHAIGAAVLSPVRLEQDLAGFDLVLDLTHGSTGIDSCLEYSSGLFSGDEMTRAAELWQRLLREFPTLLAAPLSQLVQLFQCWDNELQKDQQQTQNRENRARLQAFRRRAQVPSV